MSEKMSDKTDTIIFKSIFYFSTVILIFDWVAKLVHLPHPLMTIGKWVTTLTYPIVAMYVFCMGWTLNAKDLSWMRRPKTERILLPILKYFILFAGVLLLPSCLMFWTVFPPDIAKTTRMAVTIIFPVTALTLGFAGKYGGISKKAGKETTAGHNQEDTPGQTAAR
jgi:hypothetical protein